MHIKLITPPVLTTVVATADLRMQLRLASDGSEDGLVAAYLAAAHAVAEHYSAYPIGSQTRELALDAFPCGAIDLGAAVASISSLKYIDTAGVEQTVASTDYTLDTYGLTCRLVPDYGFIWPTTQDIVSAVKVRYVCGDVPAAVKSALLLMVAWLNENRGDSMAGDDIQPAAARALLGTVKVYGS